jgi:hypothetical protein
VTMKCGLMVTKGQSRNQSLQSSVEAC